MRKLKQVVAVTIIISTVVASIGMLNYFNPNEEEMSIGFDTYNTMTHDPDPFRV